MLLSTILVLIALALWLVKSLLSPTKTPSADETGPLAPWTSDYKQLRIEYHQSVDRSVSPPRAD